MPPLYTVQCLVWLRFVYDSDVICQQANDVI